MPWHLAEDLQRFKQLTSGHAIIMGRKTFESIGRPLPNRHNIVVSAQLQAHGSRVAGVTLVGSLEDALQAAAGSEVFIIGGGSIYRQAMPLAQRLYITHVHATVEGDAFFPAIDERTWVPTGAPLEVEAKDGEPAFAFATYVRKSNV